jgi:hypothetical protein
MLDRDPTAMSPDGYGRRARERRRGAAALMAAVSAGVTLGGEPRAARERLEEELRSALRARSVILRDEPSPLLAPNTLCFDVPFGYGEGRARLEILFETPRPLDQWSCQIIDAATQLAAMILELERATGRLLLGAARRPPDGAAPLIGSSEAIRRVRERIERVAATDFTVLIEGGSGPQPPQFHWGFALSFLLVTLVRAGGGGWAPAGRRLALERRAAEGEAVVERVAAVCGASRLTLGASSEAAGQFACQTRAANRCQSCWAPGRFVQPSLISPVARQVDPPRVMTGYEPWVWWFRFIVPTAFYRD